MRQYSAAVYEELHLEPVNVEANPLREMPVVRNERASEETSETAGVHVDDAHERSRTPDDHETEAIQRMDSKSGDVPWKSGSRHTQDGTERC